MDFSELENLTIDNEAEETADAEEEQARSARAFRLMTTHDKMRLMSEAKADEILPWHFEKGTSYHVVSYGDVDSLTFLRHIVKQQPLDYVLLSTWCLEREDAAEIERWVRRGDVRRIDFYVGEIFKTTYRGARDVLERTARSCGGRVCRFRNHSKVMAGVGKDFSFVVESSANVNTNPRAEQTCITVDDGLFRFYKEFYDQMKDFDGDFKNWEPFEC